jgi:hypothetical protein
MQNTANETEEEVGLIVVTAVLAYLFVLLF